MKRHERTHRGEKPFACSKCDKSFKERSNLMRHERTQTGEKPFACSHCDKAFLTNQNLNTHERTHHTGEKPFVCSNCHKAFKHRGQLKVHMQQKHQFSTENQETALKTGIKIEEPTGFLDGVKEKSKFN